MNFKYLLSPLSLIYGSIIGLRHHLYDCNIMRSHKFNFSVICVGNLSFGGTGKTPMVEYLIHLLKDKYSLGVLSRGYSRKTKGFIIANSNSTAEMIGDEPLQYKSKYPSIQVAVDINRERGAALMVQPEVLILDDAMQHRAVNAGLNILLTTYDKPYFKDSLAPMGTLRDAKYRSKSAQIIVVTKCPKSISNEEKSAFIRKLKPNPFQKIFFSYISYSDTLLSQKEKMPLESLKKENFTLVTGIATPQPLLDFLRSKKLNFEHLKFPDHYHFSKHRDIELLKSKQNLITTEKDYMRLKDKVTKIYYLPIKTVIMKNGKNFNQIILDYLDKKSI